MQMTFRVSAAISILMITASLSSAQVTQQGGGYLFRLKFFPKQIIKFEMKTATMVNSKSVATGNTVVPYSTETRSVDNGVATVLVVYGPITRNGVSDVQTQKRLVKMDNRGRYIGGSVEAIVENMTMPEKPMKVGDVITLEQGKLLGSAKVDVIGTYTFRGITNINGKPAADFEVGLKTGTFESEPGKTKAQLTGKGHMYLDVGDGQPLKSEIRQVLTTTPGLKSPKTEVAETLTNTVMLYRK